MGGGLVVPTSMIMIIMMIMLMMMLLMMIMSFVWDGDADADYDVDVDLSKSTALTSSGTTTLTDIQNIYGSYFDDKITGDFFSNSTVLFLFNAPESGTISASVSKVGCAFFSRIGSVSIIF